MLANLRRKSLVHSYFSRQGNISFELGCATYGDFLSMPHCQRFELKSANTQASFPRIAKNLTKLLKVEYDANGYKFNMISCPSLEKGKLKIFSLGETLVTQELYTRLMQRNPSYFNGIIYHYTEMERDIGTDLSRPLEKIPIYHMIEFCNALSLLHGFEPCYTQSSVDFSLTWICDFKKNGYRLPTVKEWRYAAKAETQNKWSGTNDPQKIGDYAWYKNNSSIQTQPTKTKLPNEWGFYDMSGNVWEVCETKNKAGENLLLGGSYMSDSLYIQIESKEDCSSSGKDIGVRLARTIVG